MLTYLRRLTLDAHLAEDLYQETMVEMIKYLPQREFASLRAFWGWLYKIALSKACRETRKHRRRDGSDLPGHLAERSERTPPHLLIRQELTEAVWEAVARLKASHRNVVALRCFNQLSYAEIAAVTGGTQMQAKLHFFRAKQALKRHLKRTGFRESHLLPALGLFGALTDRSVRTSGTAVNAEALKVDLITKVLGSFALKAGLAAVASIAMALFGTTGHPRTDRIVAGPFAPLSHKMKIPGYIFPSAVVKAYDPDANGWVSVDPTSQGAILQSTTVEEILVHDHSLPGRCLLLPQGHWVQVRFPVPVSDGPDVDLFLTGYGLAQKPLVALIGPHGERWDLEPSTFQDQPSGFTIIAYDLADIALPFAPYEVCLTGTGGDNAGAFALRMVRLGLP